MRFKLQILFKLLSLRYHKWRYRGNLKGLQQKRWRRLQLTLKQSAFYRKLAHEGADVQAYPVINKAIFMEHFDQINTQNIQKSEALQVALEAEKTRDFSPMIGDVTVGLSSGTSGNTGIFLATPAERAQWVAAILDRVIGVNPFQKRSVAFFLRANSNLYQSVRSPALKFEFFDLMQPLAAQLPRLNQLQPDFLVAQPSLLLELAKAQEAGTLTIKPRKIISVAEILYPEDAAYLSRIFQQTIHQVYQCTEGFLASTCEHGVLHFHEDFLIIEKQYLDDQRERFHPIITDLMRSTQPVIRYELNDIIHAKTDCPCGNPHLGIAQIEGRSDDVLRFFKSDGTAVNIFPDFFRRAIISADEQIIDYVLIQQDDQRLDLYVGGGDAAKKRAQASILALLARYGVHDVAVRQVSRPVHEKGSKFRRVVNVQRRKSAHENPKASDSGA